MPCFVLHTNVSASQIPEDFCESLTKLLCEITGKPTQYIAVHVIPDQLMTFGGSGEPCALATLGNIGELRDAIAAHKRIFQIVKIQLAILPDRMYLTFQNLAPQNVSYNERPFA
uniref:Macrophage migration inhibitory factor n=1 Tax=Myxine glutinosa TaxID=7769 RepID=Q86BT2_MYXGL|nr:macrophage migration inhibitory factor [Myxine glutinosa]